MNPGCRLPRSRLQNVRDRPVPDPAEDDNKRTTEDGSTSAGSERIWAWHAIVRIYLQRNTSDRSSGHAALISNTSERDRAKHVEQFDDILRNFINETNKHEGWFGKIRDQEKTLAVNRLTLESLLNDRLRGTTLPNEELLVALENIIIDKVKTHSSPKVKKIGTSAPMEIGKAAGADGEETFEERYGKTPELAVQALYKGTGSKGGWNGGEGPKRDKGEKGANRAG